GDSQNRCAVISSRGVVISKNNWRRRRQILMKGIPAIFQINKRDSFTIGVSLPYGIGIDPNRGRLEISLHLEQVVIVRVDNRRIGSRQLLVGKAYSFQLF